MQPQSVETRTSASGSKLNFDPAPVDAGSEELKLFVKGLIFEPSRRGSKGRRSTRYRFAIEMPVVRLDPNLRPLGGPFVVIACDLSPRHVRFFYHQSLDVRQLLIAIHNRQGQAVRLVVGIDRCRPIKRFFQFEGSFLSRENETPPASAFERQFASLDAIPRS